MLEVRLTGGDLTPILEALDALGQVDLSPLAATIREIMLEENAAARGAGLDREGSAFVPLRGGRALTASEQRRRGGDGPPLAPRGDASRIVSGFVVSLEAVGDGAILIRGAWPDMPFLHYHADGRGHNPVRDPVGLTPAAQDRVGDAVREFAGALVKLA